MKGLCIVMVMLSLSDSTLAEELLLRGSSIKAMEGLPTLSFVVPWQASQPAPYITMPPQSVLDDYLQPVDSALLPVGTSLASLNAMPSQRQTQQ